MVESTTSTIARLCKFKQVNTFAKVQATKKVKFELTKHSSCVLAWYPPQNTRKPMYVNRKIAPSSMPLNSTETKAIQTHIGISACEKRLYLCDALENQYN